MNNVFKRPALVRGSFKVLSYDGIQFGYTFKFSNQDTRGCFMSQYENFKVELDGKEVDPLDMTITVGGKEYPANLITRLETVVMNLGEAATVKVRDYGDLTGKHTLKISFGLRVSFIGTTGATVAMPTADEMTVGE